MALQPFQQAAEEDEEESEDVVLKQGLLSTGRVKVVDKILSVVYETGEEACMVLFSSSVGHYQRGVCKQTTQADLGCHTLLYAKNQDVYVGVAKSSLKVWLSSYNDM